MLNLILLAYTLGPALAIPYGLRVLLLSPIQLFLLLTAIYIIPLPLIFKLIEFGGYHERLYRGRIYEIFSRVTNKQVREITNIGDEIILAFENRLGYIGFYLAISIFTFLFGIFWASFFSYLLKVKRKRAITSIAIGVILGNIFWISVIYYSLPMLSTELILLLLIICLLIYGRKREMRVVREMVSRLKLLSIHSK